MNSEQDWIMVCAFVATKNTLPSKMQDKRKQRADVIILNEEEGREEAATNENTKTKRETGTEIIKLKTLEVTGETKIALQTILGFTSKGTMKLKGKVRDREVIILINSGATHNFIHQGVVEEPKLPLEKGTKFGVTIGDGSMLEGRGICNHVEVKLPELTIVADFLAFELGKIVVVLVMQWLSTTKFMGVHWPSMTMTIRIGKSKIILKGDPTLEKTECSLKTITKTWEVEDQGFLLDFKNLEIEERTPYDSEIEEKGDESKLPMIRELLKRNKEIFELPIELPPKRAVDR